MPVLLVVLLVLDAVSGYACVRARRYRHALGLGALVVPVALIVSTLALDRVDGSTDVYVQQTAMTVTVGLGGLLVAGLAVGWMTVVAVSDALGHRRREGELHAS